MLDEVWNGLVAFITILAIALFSLAYTSYRRTQQPRLLLVSVSFGLFAVKGLLLTLSLFVPVNLHATLIGTGVADAAILCLLFVAGVRHA